MGTQKRDLIFLVDDQMVILTFGRKILSEGYRVMTFDNAAAMETALTRATPDLILLDIEMPDKNGFDILKDLRENERTCDIPVIFLTAQSNSGNELEGLRLGAADFVTKPFSPAILMQRINTQLMLRSQSKKFAEENNELLAKIAEKDARIAELEAQLTAINK